MITRKDVVRHLEFGIRTGFLNGTQGYSPLRGPFVRDMPSSGAFEDYADMGDVPWPSHNAGTTGPAGTISGTSAQQTGAVSMGQGITILGGEERSMRVINQDYEISIGITHNAINDNRAGNLEQWARNAGQNFEKHKDYLAFNALNTGASSTSAYGLGYDGLSFFNDSHADPGAQYTTAQDNSYAVTLSMTNFQTVRVAAAGFNNSRGQPIGLSHNVLIVPPALEYTAAQIAANPEDYSTANRARNPYSGSITPIIAPGGWLDATSWFLVDSNQVQKPLYLQVRQDPQLVVWDDEKGADGGIRYFKWHARYALFYGDWRLCIMGNT
jgi:phage major head subunit gpT-like protein